MDARKNYRVMSYMEKLNSSCARGYVFLEEWDFRKWTQSPESSEVRGYAVFNGTEPYAEWRVIPAARLTDCGRDCAIIPGDADNIEGWVEANCRTGGNAE